MSSISVRSKQSIESKRLNSQDSGENDGPTGFGRGYKTKVENVILGKHL